jgi:hypothetical protein
MSAEPAPSGELTKIVTQEELLQHLGVTYQTLWRYKKLGLPCIPMGGKRTFYQLDKVEAFLEQHGITGKVGRPPSTDGSDAAEEKKLKLLDVKLRKELVLAERHEHALQRLKGEVVSTVSVQEAHLKRVQLVKAGLLALPGKVAARCAHRSSHEVQAELELEVHALLAEFARPPEVTHPSQSLTGSLAMAAPEVK